MQRLNAVLVQPNPKTGDFRGNMKAVKRLCADAGRADLIVVPYGSIEGGTGHASLGWPDIRSDRDRVLASAAAIAPDSTVAVFYVGEDGPRCRLFTPSGVKDRHWPSVFSTGGVRFGGENDDCDVVLDAARLIRAQERRTEIEGRTVLAAGIAGGQDTEVFAGDTRARSEDGVVCSLPPWTEGALALSIECRDGVLRMTETGRVLSGIEPVCADDRYEALRAAVRDYVGKNRISGCVLGLSGGIDSALAASLARDAVGADRVRVVRLPSRFTSALSNDAADDLARRQGLRIDTLSIEPLFKTAVEVLAPVYEGRPWDLAEENIQARLRGMLLMGVANKFGLLLLCTSNKAEAAMGYGTLYGDITGGFAPLIDLWKEDVVALCRARNASESDPDVIPEEIITREPSAELREDQKDSDSLPPYPIIARVVEHVSAGGTLAELPADIDPALARRIVTQLLQNGFKRAQSIPGPVITGTPLSAYAAWGINRAKPAWD